MPEQDRSKNIAIVGAGICGLCCGLALAQQGHQVTLFERDDPMPEGDPDEVFFEWARRGASQFRHPHAFLAVMSNLLIDQFPDLIEEFWRVGARKVSFEEMLPPSLQDNYTPSAEDARLWLMMCRRATMEMVLRRYALKQANLTIQSGVRVNAMITDTVDQQLQINGLMIQPRQGQQLPSAFYSDIVIDAAGRGSPFKSWFRALNLDIKTESHDAEIVYYTRHYKLKPSFQEPQRDPNVRSAGDLGYLKYGVFPGSNGHFAVILCVPCDDLILREAVKSDDTFDAICLNIPGLMPWLGDNKAEATTASFGMGNIKAVWNEFTGPQGPLLLNYFAVGDAAVRTNPLYGRGCSTGAIHSKVLSDVLLKYDDPKTAAYHFEKATREQLRPIWQASLDEDRAGIKRADAILNPDHPSQRQTLKKRFSKAFGDALTRASQQHIRVFRGAFRTFNLMESPGRFLKDRRTQILIFWTLLRHGWKKAPPRVVDGPIRQDMIDKIETVPQRAAA